jgi:thiol:disulfide interchange protein DsbD
MKKLNKAGLFSSLLLILLAVLSNPLLADVPADGANASEEPLSPDEAFVLSTKVIGADMIRAEWDIVDGYYLYRDKFKFISNTPGITVEQANFPKGKIKDDEFFGRIETYRHHVSVDIPIVRKDKKAGTLDLTVVSQGCADIGICYPPQKVPVKLALPEAVSAVEPSSEEKSGSPLDALKSLGQSLGLTSNDDEFLKPDEAFVFSAEVENANTIRAHWDIAKDYYLYRDKFKFELQDANGVTIGNITMPKGDEKVDETFGRMIVYHNAADINLPLTRDNLEPTQVTLLAKYQGCSQKGFCYPPMSKTMPLSLPKATQASLPLAGTTGTDSAPMAGTDGSDAPLSEQDQIAATLASGNTIITIISFFGFGLLLAFTPCVFPMIPILSSIIIGQGATVTTRRAFSMSAVYVLAMALTYTAAGIIAGLFGQNLQAAFQNPWILGSFSAVFVALAFSMFGFYDIQMPSFVQSKLTDVSNRQQGGSLVGVGVMGFLSALIVGPCVAAPLAGALIYIGQTGDPYLGGAALFALSLGMGAPLIAIGTSAGKLLPRAGTWMDAVKAVFGVMLLAVAIWMLERIVPAAVSMLLWGVLLIVCGIYLGAFEPVTEGKSGWHKLWKGFGLVSCIYGALLLIGVASGGKDPLQPLGGLNLAGGGTAVAHKELEFKQVKGLQQLDAAIKSANAQGKMVMLDLYADWCVSCKEMEKYTFSDPGVQVALADMVLLQADITANDEQDQALLKKFGLIGPPSIMFFDTNGMEKRRYRLVGFLEADNFMDHIRKVKG